MKSPTKRHSHLLAQIRSLRTIFSVLGALIGAAWLFTMGAAAASPDAAFTVANFPVEANAKNAVAAKKAAIADGQSAALRSLLKRIVPVSAYADLKRLGAVEASHYVNGFAVRREQNSSTAYYASLDFQFSPDNVRTLLRQSGIPFVDKQAPLTTIVPVLLNPDNSFQGSTGSWGEVWNSLDLENSVSPLRVSAIRSTTHPDVLQGLAAGDEARGLRILTSEYGSQYVLLASAQIDAAAKLLKVRIDGRDAVGPIAWQRDYRIYDGDTAYAMELAAVVSLGVIEGRWKMQEVRSSGGLGAFSQPMQAVHIQVLFNSAREWYQTNQKLSELPGVSNFQVGPVTARKADVSLSYPGGGKQLANELAREGYVMTDSLGFWQLRPQF